MEDGISIDRIKLNVDGKLFETTVSTLQSDGSDSLLAALSNRQVQSSLNPVFIDRDPEIFSVLLSLLRTNRLPSPSRRFTDQELSDEASYYGIESQLKSVMLPNPLSGIDASVVSTIRPASDGIVSAFTAIDDGSTWIAHVGQIFVYDWNLKHADSSSSSASFSLFSFSRGGSRHHNVTGEAGRLPNNFDSDPTLRKSRSVAISFLRSRSRYAATGTGGCDVEIAAENGKSLPPKVSRSKINFWSVFTVNKGKNCDVHDDGSHRTEEELDKSDDVTAVDDNPVILRSRSVAVGAGNRFAPAVSKQKGWYFPSPVSAFRYSKSPRSVTVT
ncbi:hypothetical protein L1987_05020 [Smallanthus sonchifolius]|uniref:Uncharacterized protein n=1 Tax=Smallanthus sonchifolius TaxID=185202 RepID=A0ACB9JU71_9ASTR|nr:hypothetical protein L1987_05020 [Smallanthus sonchifolius]